MKKLLACLIGVPLIASAGDWTMFGGDPQRTGWARQETEISKSTAKNFGLKWKVKVENKQKALSALTTPIIVTGVETEGGVKDLVYVAGSGDYFYALDANDGSVVWEKQFKSQIARPDDGFWLCPKGLNATPAADVDKGVVYTISTDGRLYALGLADGKEQYRAIQWVPPFAKAWSLNLRGDWVYTSISQNCGDTPSGVTAVNIADPYNYTIKSWRSARNGAGIWGRGGALIGNDGLIYGATGDGNWDGKRDFGESMFALDPESLKLIDFYTPENWQYIWDRDFDIGTSPVAFVYRNKEYLAVGGKEGLVYLAEGAERGAARMGGKDHFHNIYTTPLLSNEEEWFEAKGVWGGLSFYRDDENRHWVYVPIWGALAAKKGPKYPKTNGPNPNGSVVALLVEDDPKTGKPWLKPAWASGDLNLPEPVVIANGVVFALSNGENARQTHEGGIFPKGAFQREMLLKNTERFEGVGEGQVFALDAQTGETLWKSTPMETWAHFSGLGLAGGRVYAVDFNSNVYCFGVK